jgi:hypothetical protein
MQMVAGVGGVGGVVGVDGGGIGCSAKAISFGA